MSFQSPL